MAKYTCVCTCTCSCICVCGERFISYCCHIPNVTHPTHTCCGPSAPTTWLLRGGDSLWVWLISAELWLLNTSVARCPQRRCSAPCHIRLLPAHFQSYITVNSKAANSLFSAFISPTPPSEMYLFLNSLQLAMDTTVMIKSSGISRISFLCPIIQILSIVILLLTVSLKCLPSLDVECSL